MILPQKMRICVFGWELSFFFFQHQPPVAFRAIMLQEI